MKTRIPKKLLAALTALCLLLSFGMFSAMAEAAGELGAALTEALGDAFPEAQALNTTMTKALASGLAFDEEGQFKILVMNDLTDGMIPYPAMIRYIEYVLEDTQPDLVVLNGDITRRAVTGFAANWSTIPWICGLLQKAEVPFTLTFGENDALLPMSKNHYLTNYQKYANCLAYDDVPTDGGVANHNLFLFNDADAAAAKDLDGVAFNLWMLDSNNDGLIRTQSAWYAAKEYDAIYLRTGYIVPSILFTHMPLPEIQNTESGAGLGMRYGGEMYRAMVPFGGVMAAVSGHYRNTMFDETWTKEDTGYTYKRWTGIESEYTYDSDYSLRFIQRSGMTFLSCNNTDRATRGATLITLQLLKEAIPEVIEYVYEYEYEYELDEFDEPKLDENDEPILLLDENDEPIIKLDENDEPVLKLGEDGNPIILSSSVAVPSEPPVVEIGDVVHLPVTIYFDGSAEKQAFYKAGVNWFFGPLSSLIGLCASLFADRYEVTYKVNQFFGNIFGFML